MKQNLIYFLSILFLGVAPSKAQTLDGSTLWKISGNNLTTPSYLFGTIHLIDAEQFTVNAQTDSVFNLTERVAFEIKLDDLTMATAFQNWAILPDSGTIHNYCSGEEYAKMEKYFKDSLQTDIALMANQKPFLLYQLQMSNLISGNQASYDLHFLTKSMMAQKEIVGLELLSDQLTIFDKIPYEEQIDWIVSAIDSVSYYDNYYEQMIKDYLAGNIVALNTMMTEDSPELKKYEDLFLTNRNKNWVPRIATMIAEKSTFIAVGAGHLPGQNGLLQLLTNAGYTVTPIK